MTTTQQLDVQPAATAEHRAASDLTPYTITEARGAAAKAPHPHRLLPALDRLVHALAESGRKTEAAGQQPLIGPNGNTMWITTHVPTPGFSSQRNWDGVR